MPVTVADMAALMKTRYTRKKIEDMSLRRNATLAIMAKTTDQITGDGLKVPLLYGNPQGLGGTLAAAQANRTVGGQDAFIVQRTTQYGTFSITGEELLASEGKDAAFMTAKMRQMDGIYKGVSQEAAIHLFRNGSGVIGQLDAADDVNSAAALQLANKEDHHNFDIGMAISLVTTADKLGAYRNPGGNGGAVAQVIGIDRDLGKILIGTFDASGVGTAAPITDFIAAAAAGDYIVRDGNYKKAVTGFDGWIPMVAPAANDSFYTVNRSKDSSRMSGARISAIGMPIEEVLIKLATRVADQDGDPDYAVMNFANWGLLETALGAKKTYAEVKAAAEADIGFTAIKISGPTGDIKVVPDQRCQDDRIYVLQSDTWEFATMGSMPRPLNLDGSESLRETNADAYETRIGFYGNVVCHAPGYNGVAQIK